MFTVRPIAKKDAKNCAEILNFIIRQGGTTAYEEPFTENSFDHYYREGSTLCFVAEKAGRVIGFQGLFDIGDKALSIGSFTDRQKPINGSGRALIERSVKAAKEKGYQSIIARITSDNEAGLGYYSHFGFSDKYVLYNDHQRPDGRWVDRVVKQLLL